MEHPPRSSSLIADPRCVRRHGERAGVDSRDLSDDPHRSAVPGRHRLTLDTVIPGAEPSPSFRRPARQTPGPSGGVDSAVSSRTGRARAAAHGRPLLPRRRLADLAERLAVDRRRRRCPSAGDGTARGPRPAGARGRRPGEAVHETDGARRRPQHLARLRARAGRPRTSRTTRTSPGASAGPPADPAGVAGPSPSRLGPKALPRRTRPVRHGADHHVHVAVARRPDVVQARQLPRQRLGQRCRCRLRGARARCGAAPSSGRPGRPGTRPTSAARRGGSSTTSARGSGSRGAGGPAAPRGPRRA